MADPTKSATATVTVITQPVTVSISPTTASLAPSATQQFTATVVAATNTAVTWTTSGGSVNTTGLYTAPAAAGTYTVTATSVADTTKSASATVTVAVPVITVTISPTTASLAPSATQQFTATVTGTTTTTVTWTASAGSVSATGLYTAPASAGTYTVTATSVANTSKSASSTVTVASVGTASLTFNNSVFTPVSITVGSSTQTCAAGSSVTFTGVPKSATQPYTASTSGTTSSLSQVGLMLNWNNTADTSSGTGSMTLTSGANYFFIYMTNNASYNAQNLYVNYGLSDASVDYITVNNGGTLYKLGYYNYHSNCNAKIYSTNTTSQYAYWSPINFTTAPSAGNSTSVTLTISAGTLTAIPGASAAAGTPGSAGSLLPAEPIVMHFDPNDPATILVAPDEPR